MRARQRKRQRNPSINCILIEWFVCALFFFLFLFQIKRSAPYQTVQTILEHCSLHINPIIFQLLTTCTTILRFTYTERQTIYKKYRTNARRQQPTTNNRFERRRNKWFCSFSFIFRAHLWNLPVQNYIVNATFIASAVVFAAATYDKLNDLYAEDLLELIKVRTGFSDNILRNFSRAILSEFNKTKRRQKWELDTTAPFDSLKRQPKTRKGKKNNSRENHD